MAKFNARVLMMEAVAVMRGSAQEQRPDGKACPLVGAVIWEPNGKVQTACRGELRNGDHAEYTLLERKNRDRSLNEAVLFSTLEPCAPEARKPPKLSCAERIINARIKKVWVGIEDPDPTVDRKGIKFLQDHGVDVQMFDRDLQDQIIEANKVFIEQAKERATEAKQGKAKAVKLSSLEDVAAHATLGDLSNVALEEFRVAAKIAEPVGSESFNRRLAQHGLLKAIGKQFVPTGWGVLLFGSTPRAILRQAGLLGTIHYPDGKEETEAFEGPMISIPQNVEDWLRTKLPNVVDRSQMRRGAQPALPFALVREAVVNGLVHRDYEIVGAKCQLIVTPDTIVVRSPGSPVSPITLKQLQEFNAPMLSRNPELHYVFSKVGLAEERGLGLKTFKSVGASGLPLPTYAFDAPYLTLTVFRSPHAATTALPPDVIASLKPEVRAGWEFLTSREATTKAEYARHFGFDDKKALRQLTRLVELGLARRIGSSRSTAYEAAHL
jgi:ATP-dependent DNA helicase RecG